MTLRCIAVDDESMGRKLLEENIKQIPFLELVRTCKNPFEAMQALQEEKIDLMFLDIQMPGMLGTKFLQSLREKPMVIFVTAYANYAVESYDLDVIDYLMKPVSLDRFTKAAYKALELHRKNTMPPAPAVAATAADPAQPKPEEFPEFFFINVEYSLVKITIRDITHIEGLKDYIKIFLTTQTKPVLTKSTMKAIEEKLPPRQFMRIHKSFIVNTDKIESIRGQRIRIGAHEIPVSESSIDELLKLLNYSK
ncbi:MULTISPECIES: LytTR family DNA-binding domain-containing protein [Emticicia]|uniref:LytR/AlgR family response regulator transcription factor n=1 Tax=Emticicia TaxID=312278 RepID=UPI00209D8933|nr:MULTISPECIES: LytTR family DNA-binding domain-containing protein [Emticicia]UTA68144.1 LytTR family DNA-binding domain-containing protein [Emticicia sp. 21SJ11W-3]